MLAKGTIKMRSVGVYGVYDERRHIAETYSHPAPLFDNGTYGQLVFELVADKNVESDPQAREPEGSGMQH